MSYARLPIELIDAIFEHLHDNKRALGACSLVCKAWVHSARRHLFADVTLDNENIEKFLKSKTVAIPFVRRLYLDGGDYTDDNLKIWNDTFPLLVGFNVWSLSLRQLFRPELVSDARSVLLSQFTSVVRLHFYEIIFDGLSEMAQIICAFPRLKTLVIDRASWSLEDDLIPSTLRLPHSLCALELRNCPIDEILEWFLSFEIMSPFHTVHLQAFPSDLFFNKFLQALGPSLEVFSYDPFDYDGGLINLCHNSCLRSLGLNVSRVSDIPKIEKILSQIVSTHLDEVRFMFYDISENDKVEEWHKVDQILMQSLFTNLRRVEIVSFDWSAQKMKVWAVTHIPRCSLRGILSICEEPRSIPIL